MTNLEQRVERTENDLEVVKQILVATARAIESNREDISQLTNKLDRLADKVDQVTDRVDRLTGRVDQVADRVDRLTDKVDQVTDRVDRLTGKVDQVTDRVDRLTGKVDQLTENVTASIQDLVGMMIQSAETADADRAVMREMQIEVRGLQLENRRILDHLFGQQPG